MEAIKCLSFTGFWQKDVNGRPDYVLTIGDQRRLPPKHPRLSRERGVEDWGGAIESPCELRTRTYDLFRGSLFLAKNRCIMCGCGF